jgi:hypothetical protein
MELLLKLNSIHIIALQHPFTIIKLLTPTAKNIVRHFIYVQNFICKEYWWTSLSNMEPHQNPKEQKPLLPPCCQGRCKGDVHAAYKAIKIYLKKMYINLI